MSAIAIHYRNQIPKCLLGVLAQDLNEAMVLPDKTQRNRSLTIDLRYSSQILRLSYALRPLKCLPKAAVSLLPLRQGGGKPTGDWTS